MESEGDKESVGSKSQAAAPPIKTICVMKMPSLGNNPISCVASNASTSKAGEGGPLPIIVPKKVIPSHVLTAKSRETLNRNNIFMKNGNFYMQCSNTNKIIKLQVAKTAPASTAKASELKLTSLNVKGMPGLPTDPMISKKQQTTEPKVAASSLSLQSFKPIAKAPLTNAPTKPTKPQPEIIQAKSDKVEMRSIQITNLPTGSVLDFKGPTYDLNNRFPTPEGGADQQKNRVFNVHISNGRISDPNGPIKMLGLAGKSFTVTRDSITISTGNTLTNADKWLEVKKDLPATPKKLTRSSSADETPPKKSPATRRASEPAKESLPIEEPPKTAEKLTVDSLLCDEILEITSEEEGKSQKSPEQDIHNDQFGPLEMSDIDLADEKRDFSAKAVPHLNANCHLMKLSSRREGEDEDPINLIRWEDGVGYLCGGNLHFQFNELGLLDIMEDDEFTRHQQADTRYDRPIGEREMSLMPQLESSKEPVYMCLGCSYSGHAADFLTPDFCSKTCLVRRQTRVDSVRKRAFPWRDYLKFTGSQRAPDELFPHCRSEVLEYCKKHSFVAKTKLEAVDPDNCSSVGVVTILAVQGQRMLLHFDMCPVRYDFWVNFSCADIYPPQWSEREGKDLIVPGVKTKKFSWKKYLDEMQSNGARVKSFRHLALRMQQKPLEFKVGMKLEAENVKGTGKLTVATVADVIGSRVRIHFDGNKDSYDYWCEYDSPRLHPIGYHKMINDLLITPPKRPAGFTWAKYLTQTKSRAVPNSAFVNRPVRAFRKGMKLEAVDRVCPEFIRPATVLDVVGYELRILYDGFEAQYAYWVDDDSTDIFPTGYCEITGHPLEPVPSARWPKQLCGLTVCAGRGSIHNQLGATHETAAECPYNIRNYNHHTVKPNRLNVTKHMVTDYAVRFSLTRKCKVIAAPKEQKPSTSKVSVPKKRPRKTAHMSGSVRKMAKISPEVPLPSTSRAATTPVSPAKDATTWTATSTIKKYVDIDSRRQVNPLYWTTNEVSNFLANLPNCTQIAEKFRNEDIDGLAFLSLSKEDLKNYLGLKLGPAIKLYNLIVKLRSDINDQFLQF